MFDGVLYILGCVWVFSFLTYFIPQLIVKYRAPQDLKKKYDAKWAVVTGGSSGIGKSVVETLAKQGLNVVVVAYPDKFLDNSCEEFKTNFPELEFRKVPANLANREYMKDLIKETEDIDVQLVCCNAGYIVTSFFTSSPIEKQMANHNVNATSAMEISHHFVRLMQEKNLKGLVTFTSSPAGFMACPFSSMYGATKSYLTLFGVSLAPEIKCDGIDVLVVHPSPIASRFYEGAAALDALLFFKSTAAGPQVIADTILCSAGRVVVVDQGYYPVVVRTLLKIVDVNFMSDIICSIASYLPDFKAMKAKEKKAA